MDSFSAPGKQQLWYQEGLRFGCTGCGSCCTGGPGYIWINPEEIARLSDFLKLPPEQVVGRYCREIGGEVSLKEKPRNERGEYDCMLLKQVPADPADRSGVRHSRRICTIYAARPLQCRTWPFWEGNLASRAAWDFAAKRCPGMNRGKHWPLAEIIARRDARDWPADKA